MCQLTMIHGHYKYVKPLLANITLVNALDNNKDGHGIFNPENQMIWRTTESGADVVSNFKYYNHLEDVLLGMGKDRKTLKDKDDVIIMSHVRAASYGFKVISLDNTHPFQVDNIILMHNGTLAPAEGKEKDLKIDDKIDSYWFLHHLAKDVVKDKEILKPEHIAKAMESFTGKFAFLIHDLRLPDVIYVVKGRTANLSMTNYMIGDESIAFAINTDDDNLDGIIFPCFLKAMTDEEMIAADTVDLDPESIYKYYIKKGELVKTNTKITENVAVVKTTRHTLHQGRRSNFDWYDDDYYDGFNRAYGMNNFARGSNNAITTMAQDVANHARKINLDFSELNILCHTMFNLSLIFAEYKELKYIDDVLKGLEATFESQKSGKEKMWRRLKLYYLENNPDCVTADIYYEFPTLKFPWFISSKNGIKNAISTCIKARNNNG